MFAPGACAKGNAVINLTSTSAVSWPTPVVHTAIAPVAAVPAVPAIPGGSRETQTGPHDGREGHAARPLPTSARGERQAPEHPAAQQPRDAAAAGQAGHQAAQAREAAREREKQAMEHLKDVLTSVWQASAAVVDRALGREAAPGSELPGSQSDTAPDLSQVAATLLARKPAMHGRPAATPMPMPAWTAAPMFSEEPAALSGDPAAADVVAYDEHGNSNLMPLEAGSLFSHRV